MPARCVTLIGGTGFIGTELAIRLAERFEQVRMPSRRARRVREIRVLPNVRVIQCDVHDAAAVRAVIDGSDVVVNLVGILNESGDGGDGKNGFEGAHVGLTDTVLAACESAGVPRYLHVSALAADARNGSSEYLKSKGRAEERVRASPATLAWTIFRPSIVFGRKDAFFNRFARLLRALPVFPLAVPEARMAPVWVGDVVKVMEAAIDDPSQHGAIVPLCGPQEFTLRELVEYTAKTAGMKRRVIGLSDGLSRLQAKVMEKVPGKPFTLDNYRSLQTPNVCPEGCPRQPTSLDSVVPGYLGGKDSEGRLQDRREFARR